MRSFPSAVRPRLARLLVGSVALAALGVPFAHANDDDDLKKRQQDVEGRIDDAAHDLQETSRAATRAGRAVEQALARLSTARAHLVEVQGQLTAAREREAELDAALEKAEGDLLLADLRVAAGRVAVEDQRLAVRNVVVGTAVEGSSQLEAMTSVLEADSIGDVQRQLVGEQVVVDAEASAFDDLEDAEDQLVQEQADYEQRTEDVRVKKQEAVAHVAVVEGLVAQARTAQERVTALVTSTRNARAAAVRAREADRAELTRLRAREREIATQLRKLAEQQAQHRGFVGKTTSYLSSPVPGGYVTSPFGYRTHPIYGYYSLHNGTDFGQGCGAPLLAAASGTVIDTYYDSVYGNRLYLSIGNVNGKNLVLVYNHMSSYSASEGDRVERGEKVGSMGTTGWSTGCHLHFTVMADGTPVDPMQYL